MDVCIILHLIFHTVVVILHYSPGWCNKGRSIGNSHGNITVPG